MGESIHIKGVTFSPYVGDRYKNEKLKILVLGESHYGDDRMEDLSGITAAAVGGSHRLFRNVLNILDQRISSWEQLAFYNYVQQLAGKKPRQRPTPDMWTRSHGAFGAVLRKLQPDRILVLGKTTWLNMAGEERDYPGCRTRIERKFHLGKEFLRHTPDCGHDAYWYATGKHTHALAAGIFHPAYPHGFGFPETKRVARKLLDPGWMPII